MEANKDINKEQPDNSMLVESETLQLAKLYLSTSEILAKYTYEATAMQQQMNVLAQQVTANSVTTLYSCFKPER
jgi:hypothetical protein